MFSKLLLSKHDKSTPAQQMRDLHCAIGAILALGKRQRP